MLVGSLMPVIIRQRLVGYLPLVVERFHGLLRNKRISHISHSTMEYEFIALAAIGKEVE